MEVSREVLMGRLRELSDEELLHHLRSGTLTPLAAEIATQELRSRAIEPVQSPSTEAAEPSAEPVGQDEEAIDLVTVAQGMDPVAANVLRACLESHGIFAYVWGEHLAIVQPWYSMAGGGARVQVRSDQLAQAKEILAALNRGELMDSLDADSAGEPPTQASRSASAGGPAQRAPVELEGSPSPLGLIGFYAISFALAGLLILVVLWLKYAT